MLSKLGMPERIGIIIGLAIVSIIAMLAFFKWAAWLMVLSALVWVGWFAAHSWVACHYRAVRKLVPAMPKSYADARAMTVSLIGQAEEMVSTVKADIPSLVTRATAVVTDVETTAQLEWAKIQAAYTQQIQPKAATPEIPATPAVVI